MEKYLAADNDFWYNHFPILEILVAPVYLIGAFSVSRVDCLNSTNRAVEAAIAPEIAYKLTIH